MLTSPASSKTHSLFLHFWSFLPPPEEDPPSVALMNGNGLHENHKDEAGENGHEEPAPAEEGNDHEVIVIQDTGFTVKIHAPGVEPFPLQVRGGISNKTPKPFSPCRCL